MISDNGDESGAGSFPQQLSQIRVNISASFASLKSPFASQGSLVRSHSPEYLSEPHYHSHGDMAFRSGSQWRTLALHKWHWRKQMGCSSKLLRWLHWSAHVRLPRRTQTLLNLRYNWMNGNEVLLEGQGSQEGSVCYQGWFTDFLGFGDWWRNRACIGTRAWMFRERSG